MNESTQKIGFIGIGNMGWGMAANAVKGGFDITVFDTDASRAQQFASSYGCHHTTQLKDLAGCQVIVTMLPTGKIVQQVLEEGSGGGLAAQLPSGTIIVDMSSSEPTGTRELGQRLKRHGIALVDAPVSGGKAGADAGTLSIMFGCDDQAALQQVLPLLNSIGKRLFAAGSLGCGHAVKALNNFVAAAGFAATSEALMIAERFGLDLTTMVDVLNVSTGRNFFTDVVMKDHVIGKKFSTGFAVGLLAKDVKIAADLGEAVGQHAPLLDLVRDRWADARDALGEHRDNTEAFLAWKRATTT